MTTAPQVDHGLAHRHAIGRLCIEGDRACVHGDFVALREITERLSELLAEPLHCELVAVADTCRDDSDRATAVWFHLKERVYRDAQS